MAVDGAKFWANKGKAFSGESDKQNTATAKATEDSTREKSAENETVDNTGKIGDNGNTTEEGRVTVTGNEFGEYADIKELRAKAKQYYKEHLQGTSVENPILGTINLTDHEIQFSRAGLGKMTATSAKEHKLLLVPYLPELIKSAKRVTQEKNVKDKRDASYYSYLHAEAIIDGKIQPVTITIFTDVNGNKYYNHILPAEENSQKNKDLSVPLAQAAKTGDGIPAIDKSFSDTNIPQSPAKNNSKLSGVCVNSFSVKILKPEL